MKSKKNLSDILVLAAMFILFCGNLVFAQIKFEHETFAEIKAKAKAQHKMIFMKKGYPEEFLITKAG